MSEVRSIEDMPVEVDFSGSAPNPYIGKVRRRVTINIDSETIDYFKAEAARTGVPYQTIINMYLNQCRIEKKRLTFA
ncbi:MAG: BrnA antitoxin family protein [Arcanobacterium sp.]